MAVLIKTLSTIILLQLLGKILERELVVIQNKAFVLDAKWSYFFEWKNVISLFFALVRSFISVILIFLKFSLLSTLDSAKRLWIGNGPLFLKKRLRIDENFYQE